MDPPLRLAEQGNGPNGSLADPWGERSLTEDLEQLADVSVGSVNVLMFVVAVMPVVNREARQLT
jgi:hypothetical protein